MKFANTPTGRLAEWAFHYHQRGYPAAGLDRDGMPAPLSLIHVIWVEGRMVTLHLTDLLEVLAKVADQDFPRQSKVKWPPRPLTPHTYANADINKGTSLPCCDKEEDHPIHHFPDDLDLPHLYARSDGGPPDPAYACICQRSLHSDLHRPPLPWAPPTQAR